MQVQYVLTNKTNDKLTFSQNKIPFCDNLEMMVLPSEGDRILINGNSYQVLRITWTLVAEVYSPSILIELDKRG